jgi:hypothetical protein
MNGKDKKKFEATQEELNQKIEAIMGPTATGEKPVDEETPAKLPAEKEIASAPEIPEKPAGPAPEPVHDAPAKEATAEPEPTAPNDPELETAVDEIAASESDELLKVEDKEKALAEAPPPKKTFGQKLKSFFKAWWGTPKYRNATLIVLFLTLIGLAVYPTTRYFILNTAGVRSKASIKVVDNSTQQPLKNVQIIVGGANGATDEEGVAHVSKVKLGSTKLVIKKRAFAPVEKNIVVGWGSNPLGDVKLDPAGVQYTFKVSDFLSDKPVEKAEAVSGESSAFSDKDGKIVLTLDKEDVNVNDVTIKAKNYRDEKRELSENNEVEESIKMVPAHKHAFVSKRSGKLDVYKIDVDGSNESIALAGSGAERDDMTLAPHPTENIVAVVSTRDNQRNKDGFLLSTLNLVNLSDNKVTTITRTEKVEVIGWANDRFVYVEVAAGTSANNPKRNKLMSYDPAKNEAKELASANYFNDILLASNTIYYAPSSAFQNGSDTSLFRVNSDGTNKQTVFNKETWNIFRTSYDQLTLAIQQDWYTYDLGSQKTPSRTVPPANPKTRVYISNPDNDKSVWIDQRDGKGALLMYEPESKKETTLKSQSGLKYPTYWVSNNTLVYRVNTEQETADYVFNIDGGQPKKIRDVTNTGGVDKWYYY